MRLETQAILLSVRPHGEHGAVVRALTPDDGIQPGFVRGGRSRRLRPVLMPGNLVQTDYRARTEEQLAQLTVELIRSRAPLLGEPLAAAAIEWSTALSAAALPEGQPYPRLYAALSGVLDAVEAAPAARGWAAALARYELLVLSELGFGLDLAECAATGATADLAFVSPKTGRAVSEAAAGAYRDRLLPLPAFLLAGGAADWEDIGAAFRLTGHFLRRDLLIDRQADVLSARERLLDRIGRIMR
ncbi:DNA repair protein RecO [Allosphingosinicella indica]|uniref:DNA repair protein RecO n=1 Tax=Allosphingosinicella indica TaxID=941907 RepID=A0A1X7FZ16_9SPHN|nr:DNA repair protein RecO [Allosphingosinicella indica]SMF61345.1 DNA replication and repair protein RecO [Allosphingosinicella indica]